MNIALLYVGNSGLSDQNVIRNNLEIEEVALSLKESGYRVTDFNLQWESSLGKAKLVCNENADTLASLKELDPSIVVIVKSEVPSSTWLYVARKAKRIYPASTIIFAGVKQEGEAFGILNDEPCIDYVVLNEWKPVRAIIDYVAGESALRNFSNVVRRTKSGLKLG